MFYVPGENVHNFMSLGFYSEYNASLDPYSIHLVEAPRKMMLNISLISILNFY